MLTPWKESYDQPRQHIKKQRHHFVNKGLSSQGYGFSSSHVWIWELDYKESWAPNWCFWTVVLEKTLESPLDCKEIQPVHSRGDQSWVFIGRTDAETPILWPPDAKSWLIWKDPDVGKDWRQEKKGMTRGWDGWMASLIQWTWVWVNSGSWWGTGRPGVLRFMGLQRVGHEWATELNTWVTKVKSLRALLKGTIISIMVPGLVSANLLNQKLWTAVWQLQLITIQVNEAMKHTEVWELFPYKSRWNSWFANTKL